MADLTDEEYDALDEYYTQNPPKVDPTKNGTGFFSRRIPQNRKHQMQLPNRAPETFRFELTI